MALTLEALRKQSAEAAEQAKKEAERREKVRNRVFAHRVSFANHSESCCWGLARSGKVWQRTCDVFSAFGIIWPFPGHAIVSNSLA